MSRPISFAASSTFVPLRTSICSPSIVSFTVASPARGTASRFGATGAGASLFSGGFTVVGAAVRVVAIGGGGSAGRMIVAERGRLGIGGSEVVMRRSRSAGWLAIALATDHVERAEDRDDVGDVRSDDELAQRRGDVKARWPTAVLVRTAAAVGDDVEAELAVAALGVAVRLADGDAQAVHDVLEVGDHALDRVVDLALRRQCDERVVDDHRTGRD